MNTVIYHAGCADGFCAAWILHHNIPDPTFTPITYEDAPPFNGGTLYIADYTPRHHMDQIIENYDKIYWFDHHRTSRPIYEKYKNHPKITARFDETKSGARLVAEYFNIEHWLIDYTEDRDLWKFELPDSHLINLGLRTYKYDFDTWDKLDKEQLKQDGQVIQRYNEIKIERYIQQAQKWIINNELTLTGVNCTDGMLISELAQKLATDTMPGFTFSKTDNGYIISLRGPNSRLVAEKYGGGGHDLAAGCVVQKLHHE